MCGKAAYYFPDLLWGAINFDFSVNCHFGLELFESFQSEYSDVLSCVDLAMLGVLLCYAGGRHLGRPVHDTYNFQPSSGTTEVSNRNYPLHASLAHFIIVEAATE
jgi:hypothetical protein